MSIGFNDLGFILKFDLIATVAVGLISLCLGKSIKSNFKVVDRFGVPAAVLGGLLFALIHLFLRIAKVGTIEYNTTLQMPFMLVFFTSIGLASSIAGLKKGGKLLIFFWILSGMIAFFQTIIGVSIAELTNINPLLGVLAGPVSMVGGHGAATAFGQTVEESGIVGASAMALSSATFGLVAGSLLGAPLAIGLIKKYNLKPKDVISKEEAEYKAAEKANPITANSILSHILLFAVLMTLGISLSLLLKTLTGISLPSYVGAMLCAIIFNNVNIKAQFFTMDRNLIEMLGEASLSVFLSMALISLRLWELADLIMPMLIILVAQVLFMFLYTRFVVFNIMGRDYDAAVMVSGMCGSGLGATSNAMINMGEVSNKYGYTVNPYLIVPLTGAFLIDIFQMPIIVTAINIFSK